MESRNINKEEQMCIANCIRTHWGQDAERGEPEIRDQEYEDCLTNCQVCG